jgi:hypothetical protein
MGKYRLVASEMLASLPFETEQELLDAIVKEIDSCGDPSLKDVKVDIFKKAHGLCGYKRHSYKELAKSINKSISTIRLYATKPIWQFWQKKGDVKRFLKDENTDS